MGVQRLDTGQKPVVGKEKHSWCLHPKIVIRLQILVDTASSSECALAAAWLICGYRQAGKLLRARQAVRN